MSAPDIKYVHIEWMDGVERDLRCSRTFVTQGVLTVYGYEQFGDVDLHFPMFGNIRVYHAVTVPDMLGVSEREARI